MSAIMKPLTTMKKFEEWEISFKELEILPDQLQSRAETSAERCKKYSDAMIAGSVFPPVLVFETPDGRFLLADGFHRAESRRRLGFTNVKAVIRPGTMEDAILAGIQANVDMAEDVVLTEKDRMHAAEIMIRNETFREWNDKEIARRCGVAAATVKKIRLQLQEKESIPLPDQVFTFKGDKKFSRRYGNSKGLYPVITKSGGRGYESRINGKQVYLGTDQEKAERVAGYHSATARIKNGYLSSNDTFESWLQTRNIRLSCRHRNDPVAVPTIGTWIVVPVPDSKKESVLTAIGRIFVARKRYETGRRTILVGFFGTNPHVSRIISLVSKGSNPIEFMTPDELIDALRGTKADDDEALRLAESEADRLINEYDPEG